jgi:hypothetical protein
MNWLISLTGSGCSCNPARHELAYFAHGLRVLMQPARHEFRFYGLGALRNQKPTKPGAHRALPGVRMRGMNSVLLLEDAY